MERRKFIIGAGSLAAGGAAAMGTGAFTAAEVSGREIGVTVTDDSESLVALQAGTTSNDYVKESNGELIIDFEEGGAGVNPNSTYQLGDVPSDLNSETALNGTEPLENDGDITSDYAFSIVNQSTTPQDIEVEVNMTSPPDNLELYLIAQNQAPVQNTGSNADPEEVLVAGSATPTNNWNTVLSFARDTSGALDSGDAIRVSLLIVRGADDGSSSPSEWSGTMSVSAGESDDIQSQEEATNETDDTST
jgi:hypothetical protein